MKKYGSIYIITNKINGKKYVGQTIFKVEERWKSHLYGKNRKSAICQAIDKYGINNFVFEEVISCFSRESLNETEMYFIKKLNTTGSYGYNKTHGGDAPVFTAETRLKMSLAKLGKRRESYRERYVNQSGSLEEISKHAQRLRDESEKLNNSRTSPRQPKSKYLVNKEEIISLYLETNSTKTVGKILSLDASMLCRHLKSWGILKSKSESSSVRNKNRYSLSIEFLSKVAVLYSNGISKKRISKLLNIDEKTIYRCFV